MTGFRERLLEMTSAICRGDGAAAAACFTADGVYHDVFYGAYEGAAIAEMIEGRFHRDGANFKWDLKECVEDEGLGMARYVFSYDSRLPGHEGKRSIFEGVAICRMKDGLIAEYREVANAATGLRRIGFSDARLARVIDRELSELASRDETQAHLER